jgi:hypothetical protein
VHGRHILDENLRLVGIIRMWREELEAAKTFPFDIGPSTLFVAYSAWAEMTCFIAQKWPCPRHIFDLHTAYLATSNILLPFDPTEDDKRKKAPFQVRSATVQHRRHGGVNGRGKGQGQGL